MENRNESSEEEVRAEDSWWNSLGVFLLLGIPIGTVLVVIPLHLLGMLGLVPYCGFQENAKGFFGAIAVLAIFGAPVRRVLGAGAWRAEPALAAGITFWGLVAVLIWLLGPLRCS